MHSLIRSLLGNIVCTKYVCSVVTLFNYSLISWFLIKLQSINETYEEENTQFHSLSATHEIKLSP